MPSFGAASKWRGCGRPSSVPALDQTKGPGPRRTRVPRLSSAYVPVVLSGKQLLALEPPAARGAVLDLLGIGFARLFVIEEDPSVAPFGPPELSPQFVRLHARAITAWPPTLPSRVHHGYRSLIVTRITKIGVNPEAGTASRTDGEAKGRACYRELLRTPLGRSSTSEDAYSAQWSVKAVARAATSRTSATPRVQLPALESLLHVYSGSVYQLGVDEDLLYLRLGAVAAYVLLLEHLSEAGFRL